MKHAALLLALLAVTPASAEELPLPPGAAGVLSAIAEACPDCAATGYAPCGTPDVAWGRRFAATAMLGTPKRAYLPTFTMSGGDFRALARTTDHHALLAALRARFAATRVVVIADGFGTARVLPPPARVAVTFPEPLHACVRDPARPWGCCVGACAEECCEKGLGSPTVTMEWTDGEERLTLHWGHTIGTTWLDRRSRDHSVRYACLTDAKGRLR